METFQEQKNAGKFSCEVCSFTCNKQCDWNRHVATKKHIERLETGGQPIAKHYQCKICDKVYQNRTGLWKHAQKCVEAVAVPKPIIATEDNSKVSPEMISRIVVEIHKQLGITDLLKNSEEMMKNSQELVKLAKETPTTIHNTTNNNTTNAQFNVNFFLNEKCKDAINFTDFVNSITLNQEDLRKVVKNGYVDGNSKIIADMLEKLGVYRRPIHCMDVKRETVYIRENDEWEKEQVELPRIKQLANVVSHKVIQQTGVWHEENPDFMRDQDKKEESLKMMTQVFGSELAGEGQTQKKVMKNILLNTEVDKTPEKIIKGTNGSLKIPPF